MVAAFTHLHVHSEMSILDGISRFDEMAEYTASLGMKALALTDHGRLYGSMKHYDACLKAGIKPIIGVELYMSPGPMEVRGKVEWGQLIDRGKLKSEPGGNVHLTVLAQNSTGLKNLYKLHERSFLEGYYGYPRVDFAALEQASEGLIVLSGCAGAEVPLRFRLDQPEEAYLAASWFKDVFGDRYFIEIMDHGIDFEAKLNPQLIKLASDLKVQLIATNDSHYSRPEDQQAHDAFITIRSKSTLDDPKRFKFSGSGFHLRSPEEMAHLFRDLPEAVSNTQLVTEMVGSYEDMFTARSGGDAGAVLGLLPRSGESIQTKVAEFIKLRGNKPVELARADYELRSIFELGYGEPIEILADLVGEAKSRGTLVGPGRGSAAASFVCYALGITDVDPIEHNLVFERFINPARKSPPDIDVDFQHDRRDETFEYAVQKYGVDKVAKIITYGREKSRAAIKDAARMLGRTPEEAQKLANLVPELVRGRQDPLKNCPKVGKADPEVYRLALSFEGLPRQTGVHAAGLIVSKEPLSNRIPVKKDARDDILITGYENSELERVGLIKSDILALKNLTAIAQCLAFINEV